MDLKGKNILVIGGAGLIGSHTVDALLKEEVKSVVVFDNFARGNLENLSEALKDDRTIIFKAGGDILQSDILENAIESHSIDAVFHFAALWLLQCHEFPKSAMETNVLGTFNVMEVCVKHKVEKLVWSSSASVYGDAITEPMKEDHPFNNKNFYGATKICGEALLRAYHYRYNLNFVGLRYMNVYGPRQDYLGAYIAVIMKMLDSIDKGEAPVIFGDGSEAFDFISVEDCASANVCAVKSKSTNEFYNVGTGIRTTLLTLAETLVKLTNCKVPIRFNDRSEQTLVKNRIGCPEKAKKEIKFEAKIKLEEGLKNLIKWRKDHKAELIYRKLKARASI